MTGGTGASSGTGASRRGENKAALTVHGAVHGGAWREPWRPMASRDPFTDRFFASQDPLCLSLRGREPVPGDWANPRPLRLSPHRGEQEGSSPSQERPCSRRLDARARARERTCLWRLGGPQSLASLPSQGRTRGVLRRGESAIPPSVDRSSRGGRTSSPGPPILQAILRESKNTGTPKQTRTDDGHAAARDARRREHTGARAGGCGVSRPFWAGHKGGTLGPSRRAGWTE